MGDYIDFALLHKRGLIKAESDKDDREYIEIDKGESDEQQTSGFLDFLDKPAAITQIYGSENNLSKIDNDSLHSAINEMKLKVDDLAYKIDMLIDRLKNIENKN